MNRRAFIAGAGTTAMVTLAGCLGDDNELVEIVEDYFETVDEGDMEFADQLVHDNGQPPFEQQEDISVDEVEQWDREDVAETTGRSVDELEETDDTLVDLQGFEDTGYVYGDIETGSDGDIEVYYRLVEEAGLWYIWEDLADEQ